MLDLGPERRREPIDPALLISQVLTLLALKGRGQDNIAFIVIRLVRALTAGMGAVAKGNFRHAVQPSTGHHAIMHTALSRIHADMRLHAKVPLIAHPGLLHLGIARFLVEGGAAIKTANPKTFKAAGAKGIHLIVPLKATQKLLCHVDSILGELLANGLRP